jgi:hypothetical protein
VGNHSSTHLEFAGTWNTRLEANRPSRKDNRMGGGA